MPNKQRINIFWFRRDLRLEDNHGLYHALQSDIPVLPIFIFDRNILDALGDKHDKRVLFIHQSLQFLQSKLNVEGSFLTTFYSTPLEVFTRLCSDYIIDTVYTNHDYEPYAIRRDKEIETFLASQQVAFRTYKDHVIFDYAEVLKDDGSPYTVFTPYSRKWKSRLLSHPIPSYPSEKHLCNLIKGNQTEVISLEQMGFNKEDFLFPEKSVASNVISNYQRDRDFPGIPGTSRLGVHLRFGTISVRKLAFDASMQSEIFLNELIWRDFYQMILSHFPQIGMGLSFKSDYDKIQWRNNLDEFEKWKNGQTGYPIVDAGMRELMQTGFMHNRVRMITASFLTKHLLIDWRWGEAWFAQKLLDFDLASNNGGWQWAAGSGCDAAPYFRVFNPYLQTEKFDKQAQYIRKWVPEFDTLTYVQPIVVHEFARNRCLSVYGAALKKPLSQ